MADAAGRRGEHGVTTLGIGIVTFNRRETVRETVRRVRGLTTHVPSMIVVADDGSTDGTQFMLRAMGVPYVTGQNMGVAWNKNRALYLLNARLRCDVTILLEDDTYPTSAGWEQPWIEAAQIMGHANLAGHWLRDYFESGSGSATDPILSRNVTAQCSVYSAAALERAGYFDSRFRGYGHEHVEHSARMVRLGFGGTSDHGDVTWHLISGQFEGAATESFGSPEEVERNRQIADDLMQDQTYRAAWRNDREMRQFLGEIDGAVIPSDNGFALRTYKPGANNLVGLNWPPGEPVVA
jgi:glycosyltransferase involved in cell wall biosynthesis